ncbi:MAG: hypothetical protein IJA46_01410 [Bacteroidaceae bacterium]|nr:hypothetical protein [Bacteroidaceae bacterium]
MKKKTRLIITFSNVSAKIAKMTLLHKLYIVKDCITTHSANPSANTKIGIDNRFNYTVKIEVQQFSSLAHDFERSEKE